MSRPCAALLVSSLVLGCACRQPTESAPTTRGDLEIVGLHEHGLPASGTALAVQLSGASSGRLVASWLEPGQRGEHSLRVAEHLDGRWGPAHTVVSGSELIANAFDVPAIVPAVGTSLWAVWPVRAPGPEFASELRLAHSLDGAHWAPAVRLHRDDSPAERGFATLLPASDGGLDAVWLDGGPQPGSDSRSAPVTALRHLRVDADGRAWREAVLDARVCDCCQTAGQRLPQELLLAYRDRSADETRDIALLRRAGDAAWSAPPGAPVDGWRLNGCPVNGPALAAFERHVALVWYSGAPAPAVRVLMSSDGGQTFAGAQRVDVGQALGRVDVAWASADVALVSWVASAGQGASVHLRAVGLDGALGPPYTVATGLETRSLGVPRLERSRGPAMVAWRDARQTPVLRTAQVQTGRSR